ncbi:hypothetical protein [Streptomyces sp. NPDC096311]|uniref:hypothetical protein n=1 Tax=Streptomyces sp. NPDC096311 TaxID=3366083 RepID=UPI003827F558
MTVQQNTATAGGVATPAPGRPADGKPKPDCKHWIGAEQRHCREGKGVRLYIQGHRCPAHTPSALQGKPEPQPGPGWPIYRQEQCS